MKTERAIELLHRLQDEQFDGPHGDERREALEKAVRALSGDGDTIYRQDVLKILSSKNAAWDAYDKVKQLPSAQPDLDEWCPDCKEYDSKRHCCPRFNRVIRGALKDAQSHWTPCDWCKYNPPSSMDGKPCTICPAVGRGESDED